MAEKAVKARKTMNFDAAHIQQLAQSLEIWAHPVIWAIIFVFQRSDARIVKPKHLSSAQKF
jgi:hypothetical protein